MDIIGFGALNLDKLYKVEKIAKRGEHVAIKSINESSGGSAANTIAALSKLKLKTGFIGAVGNDNEGKIIIEDFKKFKVNTDGIVKIKNQRTGFVIGFVDNKGERTLYPYPGANSFLNKKNISLTYIKNSKFLHLTSFVDEKQFRLQKYLIEKIKSKKEIKISFSPGDLYVKKGIKELMPIIKRSEIIFLNANEVRILTGKSYINGAKILVEKGKVKIVVITLGKQGCYIKTKESEIYVPSKKLKRVVDTTGAGDSFAAGFLYGLIKKESLDECGKLGNYLAWKCIQKFGARTWLSTIDKIKI